MALNAVIGALRVNLGLNSAAFNKGLKEADRNLKAMGRQLARVSAVVATAGAGLALFAKNAANGIDAQAKLAQSLQTTTASVQNLTRAGELAGVPLSGLEQLAKDLTRRLSQAADGTGPAVDALERLGLSALELSKVSLDQRIAKINAAINKFVPAAQRAAVAGQLFGEEGSIAASRLQPEVIAQATAELEKFGVIVSDVDADGIERANDAFSQLSLITQGVGNRLAVTLAPALENIANAAANFFAVTGTGGKILDAFGDNIGRIAAITASFVGLLTVRYVAAFAAARLATLSVVGALTALRGAILRTGVGILVVGLGEVVFQLGKAKQAGVSFGEVIAELKAIAADTFQKIADSTRLLVVGFQLAANDIAFRWAELMGRLRLEFARFVDFVSGSKIGQTLGMELGAVDAAAGKTAQQFTELNDQYQALIGEQSRLEAALKKPINALKRLRDVLKGSGDESEDTAKAVEQLNAEIEKLEETGSKGASGLGKVEDAAKDAKNAVDDLSQSVKDTLIDGFASGDISGAFSDLLRQGQSAFGDLLKGAKSIGDVFSNLGGNLKDGLSSIGSIFSGGGLSAITGAVSSFLPIFGAISAVGSFVKGLIGGKTIVGKGFQIGVEDGELVGGEFTRTRTKRLFGLIDSTKQKVIAFDKDVTEAINILPPQLQAKGFFKAVDRPAYLDELGAALQEQIDSVQEGVTSVFEGLGVEVSSEVVRGVAFAVQSFDTRGKTEEEIEAKFTEIFASYGDAISQAIGNISLQSAVNLGIVKNTLEPAGQILFGSLEDMASAAEDLSARFGGLGNLSTSIGNFTDTFFTEAEKLTILENAVSGVFDDIGLAVPKTIEAFKDLTLSQNLMTEAGREAYAALLQIAPQFAALTGAASDFSQFDFSNKRFDTVLEEQIAQIALARNYDLDQVRALGGSSLLRDPDSPVALLDRIADTLERMEAIGIPERA